MPATPHPCFDPRAFYLDTDDSKVYLRPKPSGGIVVDDDGVSVAFPELPDDVAYSRHMEFLYGQALVSEYNASLSTPGLITPGSGALTAPMPVGPLMSNSWDSEALIYMTVKADLQIVGSGENIDPGNGAISVGVSPDGVIAYAVGQYSQFIATGGGAFSAQGYNSWSGTIPFVVPAGWGGTPQAVIGYQNYSVATAGLVKCTLVECWTTIHRH